MLDQGSTSECVAFSWRQFLSSSPMMTKSGPAPAQIYTEAQKVDEWEGEDYDGTSVRAGCKVLETLGHVEQYLWGFNAADARDYVISRGCVVLGTTWHADMFSPDRRGFIHIGGGEEGGHAYVVAGFSVARNAFRIVNSWGAGWGQGGRAWLAFDEAERLIRDEGEVCSAIEKRVIVPA